MAALQRSVLIVQGTAKHAFNAQGDRHKSGTTASTPEGFKTNIITIAKNSTATNNIFFIFKLSFRMKSNSEGKRL